MTCIKNGFVMVAVLLGSTACMDTPDKQPESRADQQLGSEPAALQPWNIGVANVQLDKDSRDISITVDCAFIEWCNRPASISPDIGTVCRVRTGCAFPPSAATVNECTNDANAACGAITQPAFICQQGGSCP